MKKLLLAWISCILPFTANAGGIVFLGDSITKGTDYGGVTRTDTFAYKIGIANGYDPSNIYNAGVGSDKSSGALARLQTDVVSKNPDVCVVMIGINDWAAGVSVATYRQNVSSIFSQLKAAGIKPVGITSNLNRGSQATIAGYQPFLEAFEAEAKNQGVKVLDLYREVATSYLYLTATQFQALYVDSIHLTKSGHQFVANFANRDKFSGLFSR